MLDEQQQKQDTIANRRGFLAQATETLAAAPVVIYAASNWNQQDQYQVLNLEEARMAENPLAERGDIQKSFRTQSEFNRAANELNSAYRSSYHKSRIVMVPVSNGKTTTMHPHTEYYWAVPAGLPGHSTISDWSSNEKNTAAKISDITNSNLIDVDKLKNVAIETKKGNDTARHILTGLAYGSSVTLLWGYEEAIAYAKSKANDTSYHHERFENTTASQETRRGFIKIGAALVGAGVAAIIHNKIQARLSRGEERLEGELDTAAATREHASNTAISEHFGETVEATFRRVSKEINTAENALLSGKADQRVSQALRSFVQAGRAYTEELSAIAETKTEKDALAYLSKCRTATTQLEAAGTADEKIATSAAILEGLGIVGAMSLVVLPARHLNLKYPGEKDLYEKHETFTS